jgi:hypothetical protein
MVYVCLFGLLGTGYGAGRGDSGWRSSDALDLKTV